MEKLSRLSCAVRWCYLWRYFRRVLFSGGEDGEESQRQGSGSRQHVVVRSWRRRRWPFVSLNFILRVCLFVRLLCSFDSLQVYFCQLCVKHTPTPVSLFFSGLWRLLSVTVQFLNCVLLLIFFSENMIEMLRRMKDVDGCPKFVFLGASRTCLCLSVCQFQ